MNNIDTSNWKYFYLKDIFKIKKTKNFTIEEANEMLGNEIPYVTRTLNNNGVMFLLENLNQKLEPGQSITIGGESASVFYQDKPFISGNNINCLVLNSKFSKIKLTENIGLFFVSILKKESYRYSYNRPFNSRNILNCRIKIPSKDNNPDWEYMDNFIKDIREREREREFRTFSKINQWKILSKQFWMRKSQNWKHFWNFNY